jgi:hypothetical protein
VRFFFALGCDPHVATIGVEESEAGPEGTYLEAESGVLSDGFTVGNDPTASGAHFIAPVAGVTSDAVPGALRARYDFTIDNAGSYLIWGRIRSPNIERNRFWFQVDGGDWTLWRITVGDIWYWDAFHDNIQYGLPRTFDWAAGAHELVLANSVDNADLDRLYFSTDRSTPPGNDTPCDPPHTIDLDGSCSPSCGDLGGNQCGAVNCAGLPSVETYDCSICCPVSL